MNHIRTIDTLPDQLWLTMDKENIPLKEKMNPIGENRLYVKPEGGFWSSTYTPKADHDSDWLRWCFQEGYTAGTHAYKLSVQDDLSIVEIRNMDDLWSVVNEFENEDFGLQKDFAIDFKRMAKYFDGMRLTKNGQVETRMPGFGDPNLYGWDSESTLWFNWCFEDSEYFGVYTDRKEL